MCCRGIYQDFNIFIGVPVEVNAHERNYGTV